MISMLGCLMIGASGKLLFENTQLNKFKNLILKNGERRSQEKKKKSNHQDIATLFYPRQGDPLS
jgi:hypothetical protein